MLNPSLRGKPIGIKQKYLLVTCNYTARSLGVRKMESLAEVSGTVHATPLSGRERESLQEHFGTVGRHGRLYPLLMRAVRIIHKS